MSADRNRTGELTRWVETQHTQAGPVHVIHVVHHVEQQTPARTAEDTARRQMQWGIGAALGVLVFLSMFALAGQGSQATGLAIGLILGAAGVIGAFGWLMLRGGGR